jgi:hypothetical protein
MKKNLILILIVLIGISYCTYNYIKYQNSFGNRVSITSPYKLTINAKKNYKKFIAKSSTAKGYNFVKLENIPIKKAISLLLQVPENSMQTPKKWDDYFLLDISFDGKDSDKTYSHKMIVDSLLKSYNLKLKIIEKKQPYFLLKTNNIKNDVLEEINTESNTTKTFKDSIHFENMPLKGIATFMTDFDKEHNYELTKENDNLRLTFSVPRLKNLAEQRQIINEKTGIEFEEKYISKKFAVIE